ncbi:OmpH family outer membrane protein [Chondrinema litorale]|uniref:OmpH family outer membrane protein n=1 Tax=Chondrinema litorale TaxID=2994555 RepID=UPI002543A9C7|nr:OmpH family outer membrane protein [Chondrinema litorale]UZR93518.1 OmpH family outer membrane protein [Chondrinema litorale]
MKTKLLILFSLVVISFSSLAQDQKFAYVNSDSVLRSMPAYKVQMKSYESYVKQLQTQLQTKQTSLQQKFAEYQQNGGDWLPNIRQEKEQELTALDQEIKTFAQTSQLNMQRKQQELLEPLLEEVQTAIEAIAKAESITFVLPDQTFLYSKTDYDITGKVIAKLTGN